MRLSLAVCQCQGILQPAVDLTSSTAAPLVGSPRCADIFAQSGKPGTGPNLLPPAVTTVGLSWAIAHTAITITSPAVTASLRTEFIVFVSPIHPQVRGKNGSEGF